VNVGSLAEVSIIASGLIAVESSDLPWYDQNAPLIFLVILVCAIGFGLFAWISEHKTHKLFPDQDKRGEREIRRLKEEEESQNKVGAGALPGAHAVGDTGVDIKQSKAEGKQRKKEERQEAKTKGDDRMFGKKKGKKGATADKASEEPQYKMPGNGEWANANNVGPKPVATSYTAGDGSTATQTVDPDGKIICHFYTGDKLNHLPVDEYVADDNSVVKAMAFSYKLGDGGTATQTVSKGGTIVVHYYEGQQLVERAVSHYVARDGSLVDAPTPAPDAQVSTTEPKKDDAEDPDEKFDFSEAVTSLWGDKTFEESGIYGVISGFASDMKETGSELKEQLAKPTPAQEAAAKAAAASEAAVGEAAADDALDATDAPEAAESAAEAAKTDGEMPETADATSEATDTSSETAAAGSETTPATDEVAQVTAEAEASPEAAPETAEAAAAPEAASETAEAAAAPAKPELTDEKPAKGSFVTAAKKASANKDDAASEQ